MATADVYNKSNEKVGTIELDDTVFNTEVREHLFYEVVKAQRASRRAGTHSTKTRAEVHGTGRKPFKQKGTGRARQGDAKNPVHVGGGVAFGPKPKDHGYKPNRKVRRAAVRSALSRRFQESKLFVIDDMELDQIKTARIAEICKKFGWKTALLVDERNERLQKSTHNLPHAQYLCREGLNTYDILRHENLVITQAAVEQLTGALAKS